MVAPREMNERASTMKSLFVLIAWLVFKREPNEWMNVLLTKEAARIDNSTRRSKGRILGRKGPCAFTQMRPSVSSENGDGNRYFQIHMS